ncbi:hypothetical protein C8J24_2890 [Sphingomonas aerolata]|uniref:Uncharacterized protein n=1 Tax=Sphingomonas aerolata TaxID=185951 RepID=A0A2T4YMP8_9SPHN|nr:hypothetical protein C8J24_2890 [Sphingomonas aerolata]
MCPSTSCEAPQGRHFSRRRLITRAGAGLIRLLALLPRSRRRARASPRMRTPLLVRGRSPSKGYHGNADGAQMPLPATPFAVTLGAELADPRRQMLGIPPAAHEVSNGAGGMLYLKFTLRRYWSVRGLRFRCRVPQRPACFSHKDTRGARQLPGSIQRRTRPCCSRHRRSARGRPGRSQARTENVARRCAALPGTGAIPHPRASRGSPCQCLLAPCLEAASRSEQIAWSSPVSRPALRTLEG